MKKWMITVAFAGICILSIVLRLYKISAPVADWHSFRQTDTASVARLYVQNGINIFIPKYHDVSNIQSGKDNPNGYRMVEFPLYQATAAFLRKTIGYVPIEIWLRLITILASTGTAIILGIWVKNRISTLTGILTAFIYAVLPYSMFYGRVILPDPLMIFFSITALAVMDGFGNNIKQISLIRFMTASIIAAAAMLVRPYAGFLLLPIIPIIFSKHQALWKKLVYLCVFGLVTIIPFLLWRKWILQYPEGIPASEWLLNGNGIRFKGSWFQWLFAERIGKLILGYWGLIPLGIGLIVQAEKKESSLFHWLLGGSLIYFIVVASGNVQHDYYQIVLLPAISIYVAKGYTYLLSQIRVSSNELRDKNNSQFNPMFTLSLIIVSFVFMEMFSWYTIRTYYWINRPEIIEAGKAADALLPIDAKVIAPYMGDTTFLYQTNRIGWPLNFDIEKKRAMGATHYVTVSPFNSDLETRDLARDYTVLVRNDRYAIIDLTRKSGQ